MRDDEPLYVVGESELRQFSGSSVFIHCLLGIVPVTLFSAVMHLVSGGDVLFQVLLILGGSVPVLLATVAIDCRNRKQMVRLVMRARRVYLGGVENRGGEERIVVLPSELETDSSGSKEDREALKRTYTKSPPPGNLA